MLVARVMKSVGTAALEAAEAIQRYAHAHHERIVWDCTICRKGGLRSVK